MRFATLVPVIFFFFNDTATTEIYTLSLHDALPISGHPQDDRLRLLALEHALADGQRSEEHTSELQSHLNLVCRLLLEKKKLPKHRSRKVSSRGTPREARMRRTGP